MRRPGVDRILVLTGVCLVLIFLAFSYLAFNALSSKELGRAIAIETKRESLAIDDPFRAVVEARPVSDPIAMFAFTPGRLEFAAKTFYTDRELEGYRERRSKEDLYRGIAPPLDLRWSQRKKGVQLEWSPNPQNAAIEADVRGNSLLKTGYRIYRWRMGEEPAVVATALLNQTSYLDQDIGPRGGLVFYSVVTVLEGRIGQRDTLIESESSDVLEVDLEETFELRLLGGTPEEAVVEVVVTFGNERLSSKFPVRKGDTIGRLAEIETQSGLRAVDFTTGLRVTEIAEIEHIREEVIRHPVFNPDGSRSFDETGFLFREETRKVPIQRLEVRCEDERGRPRSLSADRP